MTAYTFSTRFGVTLNLALGDTLYFTQFGSVSVGNAMQTAISGAGSNAVVVDGVVQSFSGNGIELNGGNSGVQIDATGAIVADMNGIILFNAGAGKPGSVVSYGKVIGRNNHAISATAAGSRITLYGSSYTLGHDVGVELNTDSTLNNMGLLASDSGNAVLLNDSGNTLINSGTISARGYGVLVGGGAGTNYVVNSGALSATTGSAIYSGSGTINVVNSGTIDSSFGRGVEGAGAVLVNVLNTGYIYGRFDAAIQLDQGNDTVINNGFLQGDAIAAYLGSGNDFFDGRNGYQIGAIQGGNGNDTIFGGALNDTLRGEADNDQLSGGGGADALDGGAGFDYARYDLGGAVSASLAAPASNTGDAAGDTYVSIEGLIGSQFGDTLFGDAGANTLFGLGGADGIAGGDGNDLIYGGDGADVIAGQGGNDTIYGQAGGDVLSGGAGVDVFVYTSVADGGDFISDFNAGGVKDSFDLRPLFDATGYAGLDPRSAGLLKVIQNGADTDVYAYSTFLFRIPNLYAPALNDTYFTFQ